MLLSGSRLDCRNDLTSNAKLSKSLERCQFIPAEVANGFVQPNHAFLHNIFAVSPNKKIGSGLGTDEVLVLVDQVLQCFGVIIANEIDYLFVGQ
ncbi:Uncharacterised protein [Mycobacterium tuberculosis]|nr:Uncharacterised protein [Mycobacterium tuberculosis]